MEKNKIDKVIEAFRNYINLKEEGIVSGPINNIGGGNIAGTKEAGHDPPVDLRKGRRRYWNPFFKNLVKIQRRRAPKN